MTPPIGLPRLALVPAAALGLLALAAAPHPAPAAPASAEAPTGPAAAEVEATARVALPGLAGVACEGAQCRALVAGALHALDPVALSLGPAQPLAWGEALFAAPAPTLLGPCPDGAGRCLRALDGEAAVPIPLPPDQAAPTTPPQVAAAWNQARAEGDRLGFAARIPAPGGGLLAMARDGEGQRVMAVGGGVRFMATPLGDTGPAWLKALALHPTGREAYAVAWPGRDLVAFDPATLILRWRLPLRPEAHGLFVDPAGRLLLVEEGGTPDPDRLLDRGTADPGLPAGALAHGDLALALSQRPDAATTAVIDLARRRLVWREAGRYLCAVVLPDGALLLATDQAIVRLRVPPLPGGASP